MGEKKDEDNQNLTEIGKKYLKNDFLAAKPPALEKESPAILRSFDYLFFPFQNGIAKF